MTVLYWFEGDSHVASSSLPCHLSGLNTPCSFSCLSHYTSPSCLWVLALSLRTHSSLFMFSFKCSECNFSNCSPTWGKLSHRRCFEAEPVHPGAVQTGFMAGLCPYTYYIWFGLFWSSFSTTLLVCYSSQRLAILRVDKLSSCQSLWWDMKGH